MFAGFELTGLSLAAVILLLVSGITLLMSQDWRWSIAALFLLYLGTFILVGVSWTVQMALVKLIAGWISALVLAMASFTAYGINNGSNRQVNKIGGSAYIPPSTKFSGFLFHILATVLIALTVISVMPNIMIRLPVIALEQILGALILIGLGLLHLGLTAWSLRIIFGLLTVLAGFEIVYAAVEFSTLVAGLLSGVNLGLAILGAYLIYAPTMESRG